MRDEEFNPYRYVPEGTKHRDQAARLIELCHEHNMIAPRARTYGDPQQLALIAKTSYDVTRRYLTGETQPAPAGRRRIAEYFGVREQWLQHGEPPKYSRPPDPEDSGIDEELLSDIENLIHRAEVATEKRIPDRERARLMAVYYAQRQRGDQLPTIYDAMKTVDDLA